MNLNLENLQESYTKWATKKIKFTNLEDSIKIITPFVDLYNDAITLYLSQNGNKFTIDDDGYTLSELDILGINFNKKGRRKQFLENTLNNFGISLNEDILSIHTEDELDIPNIQMRLTQAIITINDMLMTSHSNVSSIFIEDVTNYFLDKEIPISENRMILGRAGRLNSFEIEIGRTRKHKGSLFKVVNNPTSSQFTSPLFSIMDTKDNEPNSEFFVIANDSNDISPKFTTAFNRYGIDVLPWSDRKKWIEKFVS